MATRQKDLYDADFYAWTQDQAEVLRRLAHERWDGPRSGGVGKEPSPGLSFAANILHPYTPSMLSAKRLMRSMVGLPMGGTKQPPRSCDSSGTPAPAFFGSHLCRAHKEAVVARTSADQIDRSRSASSRSTIGGIPIW
jgi:hypothetical protein